MIDFKRKIVYLQPLFKFDSREEIIETWGREHGFTIITIEA